MSSYSFNVAYMCILYCFLSSVVSTRKTELQLDRIESVDGEGIAEFDLRIRKMNRTTHSLNGTFTILQDLDESYEVSLQFAYSTLGNNQFNEYPMKVARKRLCHFMVDEYPRRQHNWINHSNLPELPMGTKEYCPFPKGAYWIRDIVPDASWVPPVIPTGLWRMTVNYSNRKSDPAFQLIIFAKLCYNIV